MVLPPLRLVIHFSLVLAHQFLPNPTPWILTSWLPPKLSSLPWRKQASSTIPPLLGHHLFTWPRKKKAFGDLASIINSSTPLLFRTFNLCPTSPILPKGLTALLCSPSWTFRKDTFRYLRRTSPQLSPPWGCLSSCACLLALGTPATGYNPLWIKFWVIFCSVCSMWMTFYLQQGSFL